MDGSCKQYSIQDRGELHIEVYENYLIENSIIHNFIIHSFTIVCDRNRFVSSPQSLHLCDSSLEHAVYADLDEPFVKFQEAAYESLVPGMQPVFDGFGSRCLLLSLVCPP
jgi:hypothetical protein